MGKKLFLTIFIFLMCLPNAVHALDETAYNNSGLPIPRFVSLAKDKVYVRTGPAVRYPIKWVFQKGGLPIEVIQEFDTWRKIRDIEGEEGWIHQSLLSGKRNVIIKKEKKLVTLLRDPMAESRPVAALEPNVVAALTQCVGSWCEIRVQGYEGWVERKMLWGIYEDEKLD